MAGTGREGIPAALARLRGAVARKEPKGLVPGHGMQSAKMAADFLVSGEVLPQLEPRQLALTAWSLARLAATAGREHAEAWEPRGKMAACLEERLQEFGPHELSMMLWAFAAGPSGKAARDGHHLGSERRKDLAEMLAPEALRKLSEATFLNVSNALWSCATLRVLLPRLSMAAAARMATADASELLPQALANIAWALALSQHDVQGTAVDRAMTVAAERAISRSEEFRPAELVALSWALATRHEASDCCLPQDTTNRWRDVAMSAAEAALGYNNINPRSRPGTRLLAQAAWACANFRTDTSFQPLWSQLAEALDANLRQGCPASSQDLANGLWALAAASVAHSHSPSFAALSEEAARRDDFEPRQLAACAWALASSRQRQLAWLEALERSSRRALHELQLSEIAAICWAWAASEAGESLLEALLPQAQQLIQRAVASRTTSSGFVEALLQLAWASSFSQATGTSDLMQLIKTCLLREGRRRDLQAHGRLDGPPTGTWAAPSPNSPSIVVNEEKQGFVVIHKPVHWEVDNADGGGAAAGRPIPLSSYMQAHFPNRPLLRDVSAGGGFLGRLDAQSSGLVICALTHEAHLLLQYRQDTHAVAREYVALCHGFVPENLHEIRLPIRVRAGASSEVHASGVAAATRLRTLARLSRPCGSSMEGFSLVVLSILTGRKHQIRCHLAHVGHPVLCDGRYAPQALQKDLQWCPRLFLHRFRLEFQGLDDRKVEASHGLPSDLQKVLLNSQLQLQEARASGEVLNLWARGDSRPFLAWTDECQKNSSPA
ncbi:truC [Symbiodinium natans]|uniref:TruC protein n=1 Tax=Symbiodinium natans TaxID=878477 RepID=A0A812TXS2_9DINO|nr:truC [Symbiodinium natans]